MTELTDDQVRALLDGATPGRRVQFHGSYCPEAVGTPFTDWDTSHDMSVIRPDGSRYRLAHYKHASDAYLSQMAPDLASALLDARAERDRLFRRATLAEEWRDHDKARAEKAEADRDRLAAELAQARADAQAAVVALVVERAATEVSLNAWRHEGEDAYSKGMDAGARHQAQVIYNAIRAPAPADGLAAVEALRVEARENAMQALASMGQAQEAYEAQLEAEAELAAAQKRQNGVRRQTHVGREERGDEGLASCGNSSPAVWISCRKPV